MPAATKASAPKVSHSPALFAHKNRGDWGVGVLAWEADGKRGYLFDNGEERTMASGFFELMRRVEQPNAEQAASYARLQQILAARAKATATERRGATFADHVERFRETYPDGLQGDKWLAEVRGDGPEARSPRHRDVAIAEAKVQLSAHALDELITSLKYEQVWSLVISVLGRTDLVPSAQLRKPKSVAPDLQRALAMAARELLYGKAPYEQRFERYLAALAGFYGEPARWEIATALSAIVHPATHVCIQPAVFRQQFKANGTSGTVPSGPSSSAYNKLLVVARFVGTQLTGQGEPPRDLLDVLDFIRIGLKPPAKARIPKKADRSTRRVADDEVVAAESGSEDAYGGLDPEP
jgi:hypothetical protein